MGCFNGITINLMWPVEKPETKKSFNISEPLLIFDFDGDCTMGAYDAKQNRWIDLTVCADCTGTNVIDFSDIMYWGYAPTLTINNNQ